MVSTRTSPRTSYVRCCCSPALFALVYVLVYAGALVAEVVINGNETVAFYLSHAFLDLKVAAPVATVVTAVWVVIAYFFHQSMIDAVTGGHDVTRKEEPRLYNLLENLCISRGITMPKLKIMESPALNAFATGLNPRQYSITVTTGLLNALNDKEIEAVLGHELTHIKNGDVQLMVVAVIIAGVVGFFRRVVLPLVHEFELELRRLMVLGFVVVAVVLVVERQQELGGRRRDRHHHRGRADRGGLADVAGGEAGAVALARISRRRWLRRADERP
ncbi:M48 family metalloprotease [Bradyrhizobium diazoefficiens]